jgi:hypothetical protein
VTDRTVGIYGAGSGIAPPNKRNGNISRKSNRNLTVKRKSLNASWGFFVCYVKLPQIFNLPAFTLDILSASANNPQ